MIVGSERATVFWCACACACEKMLDVECGTLSPFHILFGLDFGNDAAHPSNPPTATWPPSCTRHVPNRWIQPVPSPRRTGVVFFAHARDNVVRFGNECIGFAAVIVPVEVAFDHVVLRDVHDDVYTFVGLDESTPTAVFRARVDAALNVLEWGVAAMRTGMFATFVPFSYPATLTARTAIDVELNATSLKDGSVVATCVWQYVVADARRRTRTARAQADAVRLGVSLQRGIRPEAAAAACGAVPPESAP